mmetsp:Transcript_91812/g.182410  ORF Transcript_91812/g.182410 Transcript_91812/m.182410 type:complete len:84 (+) Transcript_91812:2013-2264(+)
MQKMLGGMTVLRVRRKYWAALTSQRKCDDQVHGSWPQESVAHDSFLAPECISTSLTQRQQMRSFFFLTDRKLANGEPAPSSGG